MIWFPELQNRAGANTVYSDATLLRTAVLASEMTVYT